jgi:hypothetical protein
MIVKLLGILDLLSAGLFFLFAFLNWIPGVFIIPVALYLIFKGMAFVLLSNYIISGLDVVAGIIIFISLDIVFPPVLILIVVVYLLQKGVFSLLG